MKIGFKDCLTWAFFLDKPDSDVFPMHACPIESQADQYILRKITKKNYVYIGVYSFAAGAYRCCIGVHRISLLG